MRGLGRIAGQARRYLSVFSWLLADSMRSQPVHWRIIIGATIISLAANVGAVAVIYWYVRLLESNASVEWFGKTFAARGSIEMLIVTVAGLLTLLQLYAVSQYVARSHAIRASRLFEERCSGDALAASCRLPDPRARQAEEILAECQLIHLVTMNARYCGMAVRLLANGVGALLVFMVSLAVLFWLDAFMTSIVVLVGFVIVAAQYPPVKAAAAEGKRWAETRKSVNKSVASLLRGLNAVPRHAAVAGPDSDSGRFLNSAQVQQNLDAWEGRLRAIDRSTLTMQLGGGALLAGLILFVGLSFIRGEPDWAELIVYVTMLRLLLANLTSLFRALTGVSRFYPQIQSYRDFMRSATLTLGNPDMDRGRSPGSFLTLEAVDHQGRSGSLRLQRGQIYAILAAPGYGRDLLGYLTRAEKASVEPGMKLPIWTMDLATRPPPAELLEARAALGNDERLDDWLAGQRSQGTAARGLAGVEASGAGLVLFDRLMIDTLKNGEWQAWKDRLATRVLLIVYQDTYPALFDQGEEIVFVPNDSGEFCWIDASESGFSEREWRSLRARANTNTTSRNLDDVDDAID